MCVCVCRSTTFKVFAVCWLTCVCVYVRVFAYLCVYACVRVFRSRTLVVVDVLARLCLCVFVCVRE